MGGGSRTSVAALVGALALALLAAGPARAQEDGDAAATETGAEPTVREARVNVRLKGLSGGRLPVGQRVNALGTLRPFVPGSRIRVTLLRGNRVVSRRTLTVRRRGESNAGRFRFGAKPQRPGRYRVRAVHRRTDRLSAARGVSRGFTILYPSLRRGDRGPQVKLFNRLLRGQGYATGKGRRFGGATSRAVLAFRKVNRMPRTTRATSSIFRTLADRKGGYVMRNRRKGRYVEADLSRQVLVLARNGKARRVYHTSSGKPSTPTVRGRFRFYRREPGLNNVNMYYSVYFIRGYAIHGYRSVPTYPASAGCLRLPMADAKRIYNWVEIGMPIYVF